MRDSRGDGIGNLRAVGHVFWVVVIFVLGACIGSFLNVVMSRTSAGKSVVHGRSQCRSCARLIEARDLIPVLSYVLLHGRCRHCHSSISWQVPAVEIATGILFVVLYLVVSAPSNDDVGPVYQSVNLLRVWMFAAYLIVIFVYDLRYMLILDRFTIPAMLLAVTLNLWMGTLPAGSILAGGAVLAGFFWIQFAFSKGTWVGGGDIRMGALMGCMLGFQQGLVALFLAYVMGAIVGVAMMAGGKATRKTPVPFGSFMAVSTVIVLLVGQHMMDWYLGLFL